MGGRSPALSFMNSHPEKCTSKAPFHTGEAMGINELWFIQTATWAKNARKIIVCWGNKTSSSFLKSCSCYSKDSYLEPGPVTPQTRRCGMDIPCDGHPAEYRCGKNSILLSASFLEPCHKVWLTLTARVPCSNAANIGECKTWM